MPSIVPDLPCGITHHMVLDDFGKLGRAWRELDEAETGERDIVHAIATGQFKKPIQVIAFNVEEGWCRDVTEDIARAAMAHAQRIGGGRSAAEFFERVTGEEAPAET